MQVSFRFEGPNPFGGAFTRLIQKDSRSYIFDLGSPKKKIGFLVCFGLAFAQKATQELRKGEDIASKK